MPSFKLSTSLARRLLFSLLVALVVCSPTHTTAAAEPKKPNILFFFCDDLATQAISAYGHKLKLLETPNIDRIAKEGMLFDRCLVPNSICGPSRAVILTGKYSHKNGTPVFNRFDGSQPTVANWKRFPQVRFWCIFINL